MDARALAWIWFFISLCLNIIKPTLSVSLKQDNEYENNKSTSNIEPALPTQTFEFLASTNPVERIHISEPATGRVRSYRQAITFIEPKVTESSPYLRSDLTQKYNTHATTEVMDGNKTVIPITSTESYHVSPGSSELTEAKETETVIPIATTEQYDYIELSETKNNTTVDATDSLKVNKYDDIDSALGLNGNLEAVTSSSSEKNTHIELGKGLPVVGIPTSVLSQTANVSEVEKHAEIIMKLQPSKEEKYVWLKETVHNMVEDTMLKKETDDYVFQLHRRYEDLPVVEADNSIWTKYSRAVVESFVLDFCRNYPHHTASEQAIAGWYKVEEYNRIYNMTLLHLQQKKNRTAIQFAAPVRRAADIYKAILDTPIGIVQSKCTTDMPSWLCFGEYVVRLTDVSESCEQIWYHAQVHLTVLQSIRKAKGAKNPANQIIAELDSRLSAVETNNDVSYLFDFIIQTVGDLSQRLKEPLISQASIHNLIKELQSGDNLKCFSIDDDQEL